MPRRGQLALAWHAYRVLRRGARYLVADRRFCRLLPGSQRVWPTPGLAAVPAAQGQACTDACVESGLRCHEKDFHFINFCTGKRCCWGPLTCQLFISHNVAGLRA